jgi:DNA (cytosine-5)-methyltransferase 1
VRYGSVCSGIEAASVAWESLGWEARWFSEIEAFPSAVLAHHYPHVPNLGDMTKIHESEVFRDSAIDLLVGGTPCQSFSVAGLRKGLEDPRGNLALVFLALVDRARPRWVVWENVPGVLSSWSGPDAPSDLEPGRGWESEETSDFGCFLAGLGELGYGWAYRVLDAQYFGVAQRRRRVFVVGYLGDWRRAAAVLFERDSLSGNPAPSREAGAGVAALTATGVGTSGADDNQAQAGHLVVPLQEVTSPREGKQNGLGIGQPGDPMFTLLTYGQHAVAHTLRGEGFDASEDGTGRGIPLVASTLTAREHKDPDSDCTSTLIAFDLAQLTSAENRSNPQPGDPAPTLNTKGRHHVAFNPQAAGKQTSLGFDPGSEQTGALVSHQIPAVVGAGVRRLTPRECERLQGFPDDYTLIPTHKRNWSAEEAEMRAYFKRTLQDLSDEEIERLAADGPRYKAIGNSMAIPVMRWIGERIQAVEKETRP